MAIQDINGRWHDEDTGQFLSAAEYTMISRQTMDYSPDVLKAKDYFMQHGRGLGRTEMPNPEEEEILSIMERKAIESPRDMLLYRTDDSHWLQDVPEGSVRPINNVLQTTYINGFTIEENKGKVIQESYIKVPKGTRIFSPFTGEEGEIDVVRGQNLRVNKRTLNSKTGVYTYELEILRRGGM